MQWPNYTPFLTVPMHLQTLFDLSDQTWPAAKTWSQGGWKFRLGQGGGQRASATSLVGPAFDGDITTAENTMRAMGQGALFLIRPDLNPAERRLDERLINLGYKFHDPVLAYGLDTNTPIHARNSIATIQHWPLQAKHKVFWGAAGLTQGRLEVMARAKVAKTVLAVTSASEVLGLAFVTSYKGHAMLHALEVAPAHQRQGIGRAILRQAAGWAGDHGASSLNLLVTQANDNARALYLSVGMAEITKYHYRKGNGPDIWIP